MDNKLFNMDPEHFAPGNDKLKEFAKQFREKIEKSDSGICTQILGKSILGAPIDIYKIGNGPTNILYVGAHHGAEYITASLLYSFIEKKQKDIR